MLPSCVEKTRAVQEPGRGGRYLVLSRVVITLPPMSSIGLPTQIKGSHHGSGSVQVPFTSPVLVVVASPYVLHVYRARMHEEVTSMASCSPICLYPAS
jgi:hypothetical protein